MKPTLKKWQSTYFIIALFVIAFNVILTLFPTEHPFVQSFFFDWKWLLAILLAGFGVLFLSGKAGFAPMWSDQISNKQRFFVPLAIGIAFTSFQIFFGVYLEFPNFNVPFPHAIPAYFTFGTLYEIVFHLLPIVILGWIIGHLLLKNKYDWLVFWILAIILSLYEPFAQIGGLTKMGLISETWEIIAFSAFIFFANLIPLYLFKRFGFLAMIMFRYGNYAIWHIVWPLVFYGN